MAVKTLVRLRLVRPALVLGALVAAVTPQDARADRHAGYYYPPAVSTEIYKARAVTMAEASRSNRIKFVVGLTQQMLSKPHPPDYAIFAKGENAEKLIIVALRGGVIDTIYRARAARARAALAVLTSVARSSRLFNEFGVQDFFTFFDLAKLFGFERITISDGDTFSHQVLLD